MVTQETHGSRAWVWLHEETVLITLIFLDADEVGAVLHHLSVGSNVLVTIHLLLVFLLLEVVIIFKLGVQSIPFRLFGQISKTGRFHEHGGLSLFGLGVLKEYGLAHLAVVLVWNHHGYIQVSFEVVSHVQQSDGSLCDGSMSPWIVHHSRDLLLKAVVS